MFCVTQRSTFEQLDSFRAQIWRINRQPIVYFGNKVDLESSREVDQREGMAYAEQHMGAYIETSAKAGISVYIDMTPQFDSRDQVIPNLHFRRRMLVTNHHHHPLPRI